jgi:ATP/maltotriose-dependent transcriptional regulator MalT
VGVEIVGRDAELEAIDRLLAADARPRALLLSGEPGMGKTLLWREAIERARQREHRVLQAQASEAESSLTFLAIHDLLADIGDAPLAALPQPQRRSLDIALRRAPPGDAAVDQGAVTIALLAIIRQLAAERPVLVGLDDIQWLDRSSDAALGGALRRLTSEPVRIIATRRSGPGGGAVSSMQRAVDEIAEGIEVGPLPLGALRRLIRSRVGLSLARPALVRLHDATGGNPYFALEVARALDSDPSSSASLDDVIPADLRALLARRLDALPEATRRAVTAIAIGSDTTDRELCRVLDVAEHELEERLEPARRDGLLARHDDRLRLAHPLLASVARAEAAPGVRRELHRRFAAVSQDPEGAALHLALAATAPDDAVAAGLEEAAAAASARGATMAALDLYDRAISLSTEADGDALARRQVRRAEARFVAGDTTLAHRELAAILPALVDPDLRLETSLLLATIVWFDGASHDAVQIAESALATTEDPSWRARFHSRLAWMYEENVDRATDHARKALELLDPDAEPALYAFALLNAAEGDLQRGRIADHSAIARGHELQQDPRIWEFSTLPANWAKWMDDFDRARALAHQYLDRSRDTGDDSSVAQMLGFLAELECWTGDLDLALRYAEDSIETAEETEQVVYLSAGLARRGLIRAYRGNVDGARTDGKRALELAETTESPQLTALALGLLGFVDLTVGDSQAVVTADGRALQMLDAIGDRTQPGFRFHADFAEALIGLGRVDEAGAMIDRLEARGGLGPVPWARLVAARCRALLAAARGDVGLALELADRALELAGRSQMPFEVARTNLAAGQIRRRAGRRRAALDALEAARDGFERFGATQWTARAAADIARLGLQRSTSTELTPSELRIAQLAASGMTNREVAAKLFISAKTVEANLARAYSKLGIRSRAELGRVVARHDVSTSPNGFSR